MGNKIRIAMISNHFGVMGISSVIMNYSKSLDLQKYDITIIAGKPIANQYLEECKSCGISIVELPSRHQESLKHYFYMYKVLRSGKFDIVHVHGNSSIMSIELLIARLAGVKKRIAHSHNSTCPNITVHRLLTPFLIKHILKH